MEQTKSLQLKHLIRVYRLRMERFRPRLTAKIAERANVDKLIDLLKADMKLVASQRQDWTAQWQQWLTEGGTLNNGRSYSAHHMQLTEIENLLLHHEANMNKKRSDIQKQIDDVKRVLMRFQEKIRFIEDQLVELKKQTNQQTSRHDSQEYEEISLTSWFTNKLEIQEAQNKELQEKDNHVNETLIEIGI